MLNAPEICTVFDCCFADDPDFDTRARLVRGGDEPLYRPATRARPCAEVVYARDLAPSCLHEAAHWLRAGRARRRLVDFGYWYFPDGRDDAAQAEFELREIEIQGLEWLLAQCAGVPFRVSADNLRSPVPSPAFRSAIAAAAGRRVAGALAPRARRLATALAIASGRALPLVAPNQETLEHPAIPA